MKNLTDDQNTARHTELELTPIHKGHKNRTKLLETYDGGFHVSTKAKCNDRVASKRGTMQSFTFS